MADESRFQLDTIEPPSQEEFERRYLRPGRPVRIRGLVSRWPAAKLWTPEQLVSRVGKNLVPVAVMPRPGDYAEAVRKKMELAEYVAALEQAGDGPGNLYLGEVGLT